MNNKAQMALVGALITTFVGVIVALALLNGGIYSNIGDATRTLVYNTSNGDAAITHDGAVRNLAGKFVDTDTFLMTNGTSGTVITAGNYTILNNQIVDGELTATINASDIATDSVGTWNASFTYQPTGYITSAGGRSLATLIAVFAALAVAVFVLVPTLRSGVMDMFSR